MSEQISYVGDTGGDAFLDVTFYTNLFEGQECDFVRIAVPGDKSLTIDTLADDNHKRRFSRQWESYRGFKDLKGHPLIEWDELSESLKQELLYQGFKFVEQVAGAPDAAFARLMGGAQIRTKAQAFLNRGKINADEVIAKQADEISELKEKVQILMEAMNSDKPKRSRKAQDDNLNGD